MTNTLVVIPTYNNEKTLTNVIESVLLYTKNVLVVNDGSTDSTDVILSNFLDRIIVLNNTVNKGKGFSIRKAIEYSKQNGFSYLITLDSDGQHFAVDIPNFINEIEKNGPSLIIGSRDMNSENVPTKSSFGNKFSNFWYWAETGDTLSDTQSGYRLYPIELFKGINFYTNRFEFEVEVLVRSNWNDIVVKTIPVNIFYEPEEQRISHFRPGVDFTRISLLNTVLFSIAILYIHPRNFYRYLRRNSMRSILKEILKKDNETPNKVALGLGFGVFMGIVPIWGFQMIVAGFLAHIFKLNKALVILAANISIPPMIPILIFFSYQSGYFIHNGDFESLQNISNVISEISTNGLFHSFNTIREGFLYYLGGSFVFATLLGILIWVITHFIFFIKKSI